MNDEIKYDVRLVRHHMRRQLLTKAEHDGYLDKLDDVAEHGEETETRFTGTVEARRDDEVPEA